MECPNCQRTTPDRTEVCIHCGARWKATCRQCGHANPPNHATCRLCGAALAGENADADVPADASRAATRPASPGLTPFTGRDQELSTLLRALDAIVAGRGQWVTVTGEAGLGKSRLRLEFCGGLDRRAVTVLEGRCQAHGSTTPYLPFVHALRRSLGLDVLEATGEFVGRVVDRVLALDPALAPHLPLILHLLSLTSSDHVLPPGLSGEAYRLAMEAALLACLQASARRRATVLVLEDWHWADEPSRSALRALVAGAAGHRALIVVLSRESVGLADEGLPPRIDLALQPLREVETRVLIQAVLGTSRLPEGFAALVHDRAAGNPFFVEEICLALREEGTLSVSQNQVRLTRPLESIALPRTVQVLLRGRVDRLDGDAREVLTLAAVLGREFDLGTLAAMLGPEAPLEQSLAHLEAQEMVQFLPSDTGTAYRFKHVLTQLAVYEALSAAQRRALHRRALRAMASPPGAGRNPQVEALAYHAVQGELWEEALRYCRQAGLKALAHFAFREAGGALEQALAAHSRLPRSPEHQRLGVDLHMLLHPAYVPQGRFADLLAHMETAEADAVALDDAPRLAQIYAQRGYYHFLLGDFRAALTPAAESIRQARRSGDLTARITANYYAGIARYAAGDFHGALGVLGDTIASIPEAQWFNRYGSAGLPASVARVLAAACHAELGEFGPALRLGQEGVAMSERSDVVLNTAVVYWLFGVFHARQGNFAAALEVAQKGLHMCEHLPVRMVFSQLAGVAGEVHLRLGKAEAAVALLEQAVRPEQFNRGFKFVLPVVTLAEAYLDLGFTKEAQALGRDALERCHASGDRRTEGWALRLAGLLALRGHGLPGGDAAHWFRAAEALAAELQMRPLAAHARLGLGQALAAAGESGAAQREIVGAIAAYEAMDMPFWAAQARAATSG